VPSEAAGSLTAMNWVRQVLLGQLWFQPYFDGSSWDGPAWSISAEWLAYLLFGMLIMVIFRIARATRARGLIGLAVVASLPPVLLLLATGMFYTPWSWLPRIVMQFTAGALLCAAVRKLRPTDRTRRAAGYAALLLGVAIVGILYWLDAHPIRTIEDASGLVDVLFVPLVLTLAIGAGTLPALLSVRPVVYLGHISFSLYMVHELVHTTWNWTVEQFGVRLQPDLAGKTVLIGLIALAVAGAALLYHFVEEPARKWMRRMTGPARAVPVNVQPIHGPRDDRAPVVSARAG
jgi:peptidoglycan/LPS O-acetylase OafA/YrhL